MEKLLEAVQAFHQTFRRRRHKSGIAGPCTANPVLRAAEFPRCPVRAASAPQQNAMNLPNQPQREWKTIAESLQAVLHGGHIIRNLPHIVHGNARCALILKQQQIGEGRLRAFNLRGQDGLFANVQVEKQLRVWQQCGETIQTAQCLIRAVKERKEGVQLKRRDGWQRPWGKGADRLSCRGGGGIFSSETMDGHKANASILS